MYEFKYDAKKIERRKKNKKQERERKEKGTKGKKKEENEREIRRESDAMVERKKVEERVHVEEQKDQGKMEERRWLDGRNDGKGKRGEGTTREKSQVEFLHIYFLFIAATFARRANSEDDPGAGAVAC